MKTTLRVSKGYIVAIAVVLMFVGSPAMAQDTTQLEANCVVFIDAGGFLLPTNLTSAEICKTLVGLFGNEWVKAAQQNAYMLVVDDLVVRLTAAEVTIAQLLADQGAMQAQIVSNTARITALEDAPINFQTQIDAINAKLANMALALQ